MSPGLEYLPSLLERPSSEWYTHDICMLIWVFDDPVLSVTSTKSVVSSTLYIHLLSKKIANILTNIIVNIYLISTVIRGVFELEVLDHAQ